MNIVLSFFQKIKSSSHDPPPEKKFVMLGHGLGAYLATSYLHNNLMINVFSPLAGFHFNAKCVHLICSSMRGIPNKPNHIAEEQYADKQWKLHDRFLRPDDFTEHDKRMKDVRGLVPSLYRWFLLGMGYCFVLPM